ncbi:MAG TPA: DUF6152 family protein [Vicinamibacterales bacterium]|nr:DUF6152 family protein [Vicinamibacterales bacterium]
MRLRRVGASATVILMAVGVFSVTSAWAHHSFAAYEPSKQIKLVGVVTEFKWTNPHVYIQLDGQESTGGETKRWLIECASTSILNRAGWRFNLIKAGDKVTVIVAPLRNGEPAALLKQMTLADGTKYGNGAAAGTATIQ